MTKAEHNEIMEMVQTLEGAHQQLKAYLENGQFEEIKSLMTDCQEVVVTIGNVIESLEGVNNVVNTYAEEYCAAIFEVFEEISGDAHISGNKVYRTLHRALLAFENSIKNDIHVEA